MKLNDSLVLAEYEELSHSEIGAILNCTAKAVETRIYRAPMPVPGANPLWW